MMSFHLFALYMITEKNHRLPMLGVRFIIRALFLLITKQTCDLDRTRKIEQTTMLKKMIRIKSTSPIRVKLNRRQTEARPRSNIVNIVDKLNKHAETTPLKRRRAAMN